MDNRSAEHIIRFVKRSVEKAKTSFKLPAFNVASVSTNDGMIDGSSDYSASSSSLASNGAFYAPFLTVNPDQYTYDGCSAIILPFSAQPALGSAIYTPVSGDTGRPVQDSAYLVLGSALAQDPYVIEASTADGIAFAPVELSTEALEQKNSFDRFLLLQSVMNSGVSPDSFEVALSLPAGVLQEENLYQVDALVAPYGAYLSSDFFNGISVLAPANYVTSAGSPFLAFSDAESAAMTVYLMAEFFDGTGSSIAAVASAGCPLPSNSGWQLISKQVVVPTGAVTATFSLSFDAEIQNVPSCAAFGGLAVYPTTSSTITVGDDYTPLDSAVEDATVPKPPTAVTASSELVGTLGSAYRAKATLSWAAPLLNTDATPLKDLYGYDVALGPSTVFVAKDVLSCAVEGLAPGSSYDYAIAAVDSSGHRSVSVTGSFVTVGVPAVADVTNVTASSSAPNSLRGAWDAVSRPDLAGFVYEYCLSTNAYSSGGTPTWGSWSSDLFLSCGSGVVPQAYVTAEATKVWGKLRVKAKAYSGELSPDWAESAATEVVGINTSDFSVDINAEIAGIVGDSSNSYSTSGMVVKNGKMLYYSDDGTAANSFLRVGIQSGAPQVAAADASGHKALLGQSGSFWGLYVEGGALQIKTAGDAVTLDSSGIYGTYGGVTKFQLTSSGVSLNQANIALTGGGYIDLIGSGLASSLRLNSSGITVKDSNSVALVTLNSNGLTAKNSAGATVCTFGSAGVVLTSSNMVLTGGGYIDLIGSGGSSSLRMNSSGIVVKNSSGAVIGSLNTSGVSFTDGSFVGGSFRYGKTTFTDTANAGFWLGNDSSMGKLFLGNAGDTVHMKWDGSALDVKGGTITGATVQTALTGSRVLLANAYNATYGGSSWAEFYTGDGSEISPGCIYAQPGTLTIGSPVMSDMSLTTIVLHSDSSIGIEVNAKLSVGGDATFLAAKTYMNMTHYMSGTYGCDVYFDEANKQLKCRYNGTIYVIHGF